MSSYGKFSLGLLFLLMAGAQLKAQWDPDSISSVGGTCGQDIAVRVTDSTGMVAIVGAAVMAETNSMEWTTNSQGIAAIPCRSVEEVAPVLKVSAPGYRTEKVTLIPDSRLPFVVRLDKGGGVYHSRGTSVNAYELKPYVKNQSLRLQKEAEKALADKNYDRAEKLLLEALQLTPSEATITNNLGIAALARNDIISAGEWFQMAAEAAPYRWSIQGNLGMVRWMQRRPEESYQILVKAFANGYESNLGHYILGTVGVRMGNCRDAVSHLKKISADRFPYRDLYLSIALRNCGDIKAAERTYLSFLRRHPAPLLLTSLR